GDGTVDPIDDFRTLSTQSERSGPVYLFLRSQHGSSGGVFRRRPGRPTFWLAHRLPGIGSAGPSPRTLLSFRRARTDPRPLRETAGCCSRSQLLEHGRIPVVAKFLSLDRARYRTERLRRL